MARRAQREPVERLAQVGDEVVDVLDADRQADEVGRHLELGAGDATRASSGPGCSMSDSTPPSDSPEGPQLRSRRTTFVGDVLAALTRKATMPPKRFIWRAATSWLGWSGRPG